ncbi:MAG: hypothetical protein Tsb006_1590 [Rickettsiaceae bacterium]
MMNYSKKPLEGSKKGGEQTQPYASSKHFNAYTPNTQLNDYDPEAYARREAIRRADERFEKLQAEEAASKAARIQEELKGAQSDPKAMTPNQIYSSGLAYQAQGEPLEAAQCFWKALVCGEGKAAYDLCVMFKDGIGVQQNIEVAKLMIGLWRDVKSACNDGRIDELVNTLRITLAEHDLMYEIRSAFWEAYETFTDRPVTTDIIEQQLEIFNNTTKSCYPETSALHTYTIPELMVIHVEDAEVEVQPMGQSSDWCVTDCCIIM